MLQVGWAISLPGSIWGSYAEDESTQEWAKINSNKPFKVVITNWSKSSGFTIQHGSEDPFMIHFDHIWPYLKGAQQQHILKHGGSAPANADAVLAKYGNGGRKVAGETKARGARNTTSPTEDGSTNGARKPKRRQPSPVEDDDSPRGRAGAGAAPPATSASGRPVRQAAAIAAAAAKIQKAEEEELERQEEEQERRFMQQKQREKMLLIPITKTRRLKAIVTSQEAREDVRNRSSGINPRNLTMLMILNLNHVMLIENKN